METDDWLELAEAAQILGVHQSTLRRWADAGKIAHIRTLSGRRRFNRSAIQQAQKDMIQSAPKQEAEQFELKTLDMARQRTNDLTGRQANWFIQLNDEQRLLFRYSGQRLLGLMMQFISRSDSAETFLEEGKRVAGDYGRICYKAGLTVSQTAEAFQYFRRSILESVQATAGLNGPHDQDGHRIILRTLDFFDALLVATIESYAALSR
jgi:excisionase family DNA binding protein